MLIHHVRSTLCIPLLALSTILEQNIENNLVYFITRNMANKTKMYLDYRLVILLFIVFSILAFPLIKRYVKSKVDKMIVKKKEEVASKLLNIAVNTIVGKMVSKIDDFSRNITINKTKQ